MTEANEELKKTSDVESKANLSDMAAQTEEWVRKKVVPPPTDDLDPSDDDRSPGGSDRGLRQPIVTSPHTQVEE